MLIKNYKNHINIAIKIIKIILTMQKLIKGSGHIDIRALKGWQD